MPAPAFVGGRIHSPDRRPGRGLGAQSVNLRGGAAGLQDDGFCCRPIREKHSSFPPRTKIECRRIPRLVPSRRPIPEAWFSVAPLAAMPSPVAGRFRCLASPLPVIESRAAIFSQLRFPSSAALPASNLTVDCESVAPLLAFRFWVADASGTDHDAHHHCR